MTTPALAENVRGKGRHYRVPTAEEMIAAGISSTAGVMDYAGQLVISVTNAQSALAKPALPRWAAKVVAEQAWALRGSLAELDEAEAVDMLKGSPWRASTRASNRGSTLHDLLEALTLGLESFELEGEAAAYRDSIDRFLSEHELVPWHTEVTMFGDGYAGTADFLGLLDGRACVMDYKTGTKKLYPEVAIQATALRYADVMVVNGQILPVPDTECGVAVLIRPDGYEIAEVVDPDRQYRAFRALLDIRGWQNGDSPITEWQHGRELDDEPEEGS